MPGHRPPLNRKRISPAQLPSSSGLVAWGSAVSALLPVALGASIIGPQGLAWMPAVLALALALRPGYGGPLGLAVEMERLDRPLFIALALFFAWAATRSAISPQTETGLVAVGLAMLTVAAVAGAVALAPRLADVRPWRWGFFVLTHVVFAFAIALVVNHVVDLVPLGGRRLGMIWHYNRAAVMAALVTPLALFALVQGSWSGWQRWVLAALVVGAGATAVFASESASAQLAFVVLIATGMIWLAFGTLTIWLSVAAFATLTLALPWMMPALHTAARGSALWTFQPGTFAARLNIWAGTADQIRERPWFGHGAEYARIAGFIDPQSGERAFHNHPHSLPMQLWLDLGLVGVLLFLAVLVAGYRLISRQERVAALMLTAITNAGLAVLSVSHGMWQGWYLGLAGIVMAYALILIARTRLP